VRRSGICEHGRQKHFTGAEDGIMSMAKKAIYRSRNSICEHNEQTILGVKSSGMSIAGREDCCKECRGSDICEHGRQKNTARSAEGSGM
jgi:hypothetical protein